MTRLCRQMHERGFICYRGATRRLLEENSYASVKSGSFMAAAWRRAAAVGSLRRAASQVLRLRAALGSAWWAIWLRSRATREREREKERSSVGTHSSRTALEGASCRARRPSRPLTTRPVRRSSGPCPPSAGTQSSGSLDTRPGTPPSGICDGTDKTTNQGYARAVQAKPREVGRVGPRRAIRRATRSLRGTLSRDSIDV